ncbi:MAG: hypothetical protein JRD89_16810 [Deltaproteobacteria bacterium]|nr:hypothetical protein [Deltaproteobacteria bacterium]
MTTNDDIYYEGIALKIHESLAEERRGGDWITPITEAVGLLRGEDERAIREKIAAMGRGKWREELKREAEKRIAACRSLEEARRILQDYDFTLARKNLEQYRILRDEIWSRLTRRKHPSGSSGR